MISKNSFLIFNNVLRELYQCQTYGELGQTFLPMLKMLIPFRYASIMRSQEGGAPIRLVDPLCTPAEFAEAERNYMRFADDDYTGWLSCCREDGSIIPCRITAHRSAFIRISIFLKREI